MTLPYPPAAADNAPPPAPPPPRCANCGSEVPRRFCGECGQRNATRLVAVRRILWDAMDDQLSVNSALPRTLKGLLFHPGFLTREYVAGRIVRYIAPFRLYLITSLLFFLALAFNADPRRLADEVSRAEAARDSARGAAPVREPLVRTGLRQNMVGIPVVLRPIARRVAQQEERLNAMPRGELVRGLVAGVEEHAPKAVFLLLPIFALLLKLLYVRRGRLYVEHFVFALHVHSFAYLVFTLMFLIPGTYSALFLLWVPAYVLWAMKRVYGQGLVKTGVKFILLSNVYFMLLVSAMAATVVITTLML